MIRKESNEGIGYSVVEQHSIRHVFAAAVPRAGTELAEQADAVCERDEIPPVDVDPPVVGGPAAFDLIGVSGKPSC